MYFENKEAKSASCPDYKKLQKILSLRVKEKEKKF
jgi:hypothetical protein